MNTTTTAIHPQRARRRRRVLAVAVTAIAAALVLSGPAAAQPGGVIDDELLPGPGPDPDPDVALEAWDQCDPAGVTYNVAVLGGPDDRPFHISVNWNEQGGPASGSVGGAEGSIETGEGTFELIAVVDYPAVATEDTFYAAVSISSAPVTVTVSCEADDDGGDDGDDDGDNGGGGNGGGGNGGGGNGGGQLDPDVRSATPTFTG